MKWKVPYIDLSRQFSRSSEQLISEFERVMMQGSFILRDDVKRFEENMQRYLCVRNVIGVNSGTDALYLATDVLGIGHGDEVITVANSFVASIASIVRRGAKPVLVDICDDFNMDVEKVEARITDKTRAIMPVHLHGRACKMDVLEDLAKRYNLAIIEDAAQSIGAKYYDKKVGSYGIGCFSLHPLKSLSCAGDGGFISTNDDKLAERLRMIRDHGQKEKGEFLCFGYNSRLDNLQAAILNVKLSHLSADIERRREIASRYNEELSSTPLILPPPPSNGEYFDTYNSYVIRSENRDELQNYLKVRGIEVFIHIPKPLYKHKGLGIEDAQLRKNEKICAETISIPIFPGMDEEQISYVASSIREFFEK